MLILHIQGNVKSFLIYSNTISKIFLGEALTNDGRGDFTLYVKG